MVVQHKAHVDNPNQQKQSSTQDSLTGELGFSPGLEASSVY
jgi:hypothetical protein